jgi:hypothetical protein
MFAVVLPFRFVLQQQAAPQPRLCQQGRRMCACLRMALRSTTARWVTLTASWQRAARQSKSGAEGLGQGEGGTRVCCRMVCWALSGLVLARVRDVCVLGLARYTVCRFVAYKSSINSRPANVAIGWLSTAQHSTAQHNKACWQWLLVSWGAMFM